MADTTTHSLRVRDKPLKNPTNDTNSPEGKRAMSSLKPTQPPWPHFASLYSPRTLHEMGCDSGARRPGLAALCSRADGPILSLRRRQKSGDLNELRARVNRPTPMIGTGSRPAGTRPTCWYSSMNSIISHASGTGRTEQLRGLRSCEGRGRPRRVNNDEAGCAVRHVGRFPYEDPIQEPVAVSTWPGRAVSNNFGTAGFGFPSRWWWTLHALH